MNFDKLPTSNVTSGTDLTSTKKIIFLSDGYAVEYSSISEPRKVISFIGPQGFVLKTTSESVIIAATNLTLVGIFKSELRSLLHEFEEARRLYRIFKNVHLDKIAKYGYEHKIYTPAERYLRLLKTSPWVKEIVSPEDIASYLNISLGDYTKMCVIE
jgi:hypothetical protein